VLIKHKEIGFAKVPVPVPGLIRFSLRLRLLP